MNIVRFPNLTASVRNSMRRRLDGGADPSLIARQYGVTLRWLWQQFHVRTRRAA